MSPVATHCHPHALYAHLPRRPKAWHARQASCMVLLLGPRHMAHLSGRLVRAVFDHQAPQARVVLLQRNIHDLRHEPR
jgi:hypothetical protein